MAATYRAPGQIITSLLDTDWYKLTMMQGVHHNYPNASVTWEFRCRDAEDLRPYLDEIRAQIDGLASLSLRLSVARAGAEPVRRVETASHKPMTTRTIDFPHPPRTPTKAAAAKQAMASAPARKRHSRRFRVNLPRLTQM